MPLAVLIELKFGEVCFCGGRKTGVTREKPLEQGDNQQQIQLTYGTRWELTPGTHWLEASDPTTARSLLPNYSVPPEIFFF